MHVEEISSILDFCSRSEVKITIVTAERDSEWNVRCGELDARTTAQYELRYLTDRAVHLLLAKLEEHNALGLLAEQDYEGRVDALRERARRQILVALHEATLGRPFEEIVVNEYSRIQPEDARLLYLDICTLNRFGVGVRAGLIFANIGNSIR